MVKIPPVFMDLVSDVASFSEHASGIRLRAYQQQVARSIVESVVRNHGLAIVVLFPRQSGKNELQAQIETYLLSMFSRSGAEMVKVSPTWKPQSINAMRRLQRVLERNFACRSGWRKESGYIYRVGNASLFFLSGSPETNIVGATASLLLEVDEAQDILPAKFDKDIAPMAASTNATRVFWGTAWTSHTLLARELRAARLLEEQDGQRRVFICTADQVSQEVPAYGDYVRSQIQRLGRHHPMIKTQFFSEEIDGQAGLFPPQRRALMSGTHLRQTRPIAGRAYAFTLDVGGEEQAAPLSQAAFSANAASDHAATALTIFEVDLGPLSDPLLRAPLYRVVDRRQWTGTKHTDLYAQLLSLAALWHPLYIVVDATGVGAGLASFLDKSLPGQVIPFVFSSFSKSKLAWDFLAVIESGRFKDWYAPQQVWDEQTLFWQQVEACQAEIIPGPEQRLKWGVPDSVLDPATRLRLHDDLLLSAALCALLDGQSWPRPGLSILLPRPDPLQDIDHESF